jgi:OOP family OmpA-OmpF porin
VNTFQNCVRTQWNAKTDECAVKVAVNTRVHNIQHHQIPDEERTAYFQFDRSELMNSEKDKLSTLASTLKEMDDITGVSIVGYADRIGSEEYNENLSKKRAKVVEGYLKAHGYLNTTIAKTRWLGESVPVTECATGLGRAALITCLQKDRRVTVEIQYKDEVTDTITNETTTN